MHSSKLLKLIKTLSSEEMRWMAKFVRSPYHNSNKEVVGLFDYIRKYHPDCDSSKLSREATFKKIWPKETFNDRRLRVLMFRLSDLVEEFLMAEKLKKDKVQREKIMISAVGERRALYDLFVKKSEVLLEQLEEQPYRDEAFYELQWQLKRDLLAHPELNRLEIKPNTLMDVMEELDTYYMIAKLGYSGDLLNRQNILNEKYDILLLDQLRKLANSSPKFENNVVIQVYNDILGLMENNIDSNIYDRLEKNFTHSFHLFKRPDQSSILRYLINCTIQLYINGNTSYLNKQFDLYRLGLDRKLFIQQGKLPSTIFLNIVVTATTVKAAEWLKTFIETYAHGIADIFQELSWAYYYSCLNDFEKSNHLLICIDSRELPIQLRIKLLSLQNHFELFLEDDNYYDLFQTELNAFEKFMRRNALLTENKKQAYLNTVFFLRYLVKIGNTPYNTNRVEMIQKLKLELISTKSLANKKWLEDKLDAIEMFKV